jgi:hypothetical protein
MKDFQLGRGSLCTRATASMISCSVAICLLIMSVGVGCSGQCRQVRSDYRQALQGETALSQELATGEEPTQLGVAIKTELLNEVANTALQTTLKSGLAALSKVDVGAGQTIAVKTRGDIVNLQVNASDACEHCFEISGGLDGAASLDIPLVGTKSTRLTGNLSIVAPLLLARGHEGGGVLKLDLSEAARLGKSSLNTRLADLRSSWAQVLRSKLSDILLERLLKGAEPVELVNFEMPNFGIPGLDVFPVQLVTNADAGTIFAGFSTNIAGLSGDQGIEPVTELADDQNLALAFNPNLVVQGVSLMMKTDVVSRTYTTDGEPLRAGPAHASVNAVRFTKGRVGELPMAMDFEVFNMPDSGICFSADGRATGRIALRGRNLEVSLTEVDIVDASIPGLVTATDWVQADFLQGGKRIVRQSLDEQNVAVPGGKLDFKGLSLELSGGAVVLKGVSAIQDPRASLK